MKMGSNAKATQERPKACDVTTPLSKSYQIVTFPFVRVHREKKKAAMQCNARHDLPRPSDVLFNRAFPISSHKRGQDWSQLPTFQIIHWFQTRTKESSQEKSAIFTLGSPRQQLANHPLEAPC
jgi:hypothetical protein